MDQHLLFSPCSAIGYITSNCIRIPPPHVSINESFPSPPRVQGELQLSSYPLADASGFIVPFVVLQILIHSQTVFPSTWCGCSAVGTAEISESGSSAHNVSLETFNIIRLPMARKRTQERTFEDSLLVILFRQSVRGHVVFMGCSDWRLRGILVVLDDVE